MNADILSFFITSNYFMNRAKSQSHIILYISLSHDCTLSIVRMLSLVHLDLIHAIIFYLIIILLDHIKSYRG